MTPLHSFKEPFPTSKNNGLRMAMPEVYHPFVHSPFIHSPFAFTADVSGVNGHQIAHFKRNQCFKYTCDKKCNSNDQLVLCWWGGRLGMRLHLAV